MITHTLFSDSIQTSPGIDGLVFDADPETWIIAPGVVVFSETHFAVASGGFGDNTLVNFGRIYAAANNVASVHLEEGNGRVVNAAGAEIFGSRNGVDFLGSGSQSLSNSGAIVGADNNGVFFSNNAHAVTVNNHGYIFGGEFGVENASNFVGGLINNFGIIKAGAITTDTYAGAISLYTEPSLITTIVNAPGALIQGAINSIYTNSGSFHLINHGTLVGNILDGDDGSDVIFNFGRIKGQIFLDGNSIYSGASGSAGPIHVGTGNALITGGASADRFVFDSTIEGQVTRITNFQHGIDKIVLSEADFLTIGIGAIGHFLPASDFHVGAAATTATQYIVYNHANGFLYYDPAGNLGPQIHFATLTSHPLLTHTDILIAA